VQTNEAKVRPYLDVVGGLAHLNGTLTPSLSRAPLSLIHIISRRHGIKFVPTRSARTMTSPRATMSRPRTSDKHVLRILLSVPALLFLVGSASASSSSSSDTNRIRAVQVRPVPSPPPAIVAPAPPSAAPASQVGGDYCTWAPDLECYPLSDGRPECCGVDEGAACPDQRPPCDEAGSDSPSSTPSMVPTSPGGGGAPSSLPSREPLGADYCTWAPNVECYPDTNGWPACCTENSDACPEERPPCSSGPTALAPAITVTRPPSLAPAPAPSPTRPSSPTPPSAPTSTSGGVSVSVRSWTSSLGVALIVVLASLL
jgi:hypothetical protein